MAEAERDKTLKVEQFRAERDRAKAEADVAYSLREIEKQSEVEKEKASLAEQAANRVEKELVASVDKPAEAARRKTEIEAEAQKAKAIRYAEAEAEKIRIEAQAKAEAKKIEAQADAEMIRLKAEADAEAIRAKGIAGAEAEAKAIQLKGDADAGAIRAKGLAEAEAKSRLADAMAKYGEAAVTEMLINKLPEIMSQVAGPMSNIDKITVIDSGNGGENTGASKIAKTVTNIAGTGFEVLKDLTGLDVTELMKGFTQKKGEPAEEVPEEKAAYAAKDEGTKEV